jgi:hypothetical protein
MNWFSLEPYTDSLGLVTLNDKAVDGPGAGNLLLHTALYYVAAYKDGFIPKKLFQEVIKTCEVKPGLFWRSPYKIGDRQQHDDYIGIAAAAYFYAPNIAREIVEHGETHDWCYNSQNPEMLDLTLVHDRFIGQVPFYRMCAHQRLSIWEAIPLAIKAMTMSFSSNGDSAIHSYLIFSVGKAAMPVLFNTLWMFSGFSKEIGPKFKPYLGEGHPLNNVSK